MKSGVLKPIKVNKKSLSEYIESEINKNNVVSGPLIRAEKIKKPQFCITRKKSYSSIRPSIFRKKSCQQIVQDCSKGENCNKNNETDRTRNHTNSTVQSKSPSMYLLDKKLSNDSNSSKQMDRTPSKSLRVAVGFPSLIKDRKIGRNVPWTINNRKQSIKKNEINFIESEFGESSIEKCSSESFISQESIQNLFQVCL